GGSAPRSRRDAAASAGAAGARDAAGRALADDQRAAHGGTGGAPGDDDRADRERDASRAGGPVSDRDPLSAGRGGGGGRDGRRGLCPAAPLHGSGTARAASELARARLITCTVQKHGRTGALPAAAA